MFGGFGHTNNNFNMCGFRRVYNYNSIGATACPDTDTEDDVLFPEITKTGSVWKFQDGQNS